MIFVTVGSDEPFDRLIQAVDDWAGNTGRRDVFAQIGRGQWRPRHIEYCRFLTAAEFRAKLNAARAVVAHAGMGTILSALQYQTPIIVMPRRASLGEARNEHQLATVRHLSGTHRIAAASDEEELRQALDGLDQVVAHSSIGATAQTPLIEAVRAFIQAR